jgi:hypothetical protein
MHYHGTPITPRATFLALAGRSFCVSYADSRDVESCHEIGQSVMLDNGAFTFWRDKVEGRQLSAKGRAAAVGDWSGYYAWCAPWLEYRTTWAVIPDVIDGSEDENDELVEAWPFGARGAPVWHLHESLERLLRLAGAWPLVCIGSSGAYATPGRPSWHARMVAAMNALCGDGPPPCALHMLRGLAQCGGPYPFASADSTSIAVNHAGNNVRATPRKDPRRMADEIDARQCPARWRTVQPLAMLEGWAAA